MRGTVAPEDFIVVAEETGLIVPIGEWVLDEVCQRRQLEYLEGAEDYPMPVSVNVSARQLLQSGFVDRIRRTLSSRGLEPSELQHRGRGARKLLDDHDAIRDALHGLKDSGVRLAIDDFGTGGSSLTYLRRFPFDELKIDDTFVAGARPQRCRRRHRRRDHRHGARWAWSSPPRASRRMPSGSASSSSCERGQGYHLGGPETGDARHLRLVRRRPA